MISTFVRADRLRLATLFQSTEETRYYLNGVHVQTAGNGIRLAATDGHRLAVFRDDTGFTSFSCIISLPKTARLAIKSTKHRDFCWFGIVGEHDGTGRQVARIFNGFENNASLDEVREGLQDPKDRRIIWSGAVDLIDGQFPDIELVIPNSCANAAPAAAFRACYMADFGTVAGDLDAAAPVRVFHNGDGPAMVDCGRSDFLGVVMPIRADVGCLVQKGGSYEPPGWAKRAA